MFNNLFASIGSSTFTNAFGAVLNNVASGTSVGMITNACGGTLNDLGDLWLVGYGPCVWTGAGGNDSWSNPANWADGIVPTTVNPIVIDGEAGGDASVVLNVEVALYKQQLRVQSGDTLTIGDGGRLRVRMPGGQLINRGTVVIGNYGWMEREDGGYVDNSSGVIRNECRGHAPILGISGQAIVFEPCYWDGGGATNNWSDAANWDSNSVPESGDSVVIGDFAGVGTVVNMDTDFTMGVGGSVLITSGQTLNIEDGITLQIAAWGGEASFTNEGTVNLNGGTLHNYGNGMITNHGVINLNGGTLNNQDEVLVNESGAAINIYGGEIINQSSSRFTSYGDIYIGSTGRFTHSTWATLRTTGQFINEGTFWGLTQGGAFTIAEGAWTNSGTLQQGGVDKFYVAPGASLTNTGQIFMRIGNKKLQHFKVQLPDRYWDHVWRHDQN